MTTSIKALVKPELLVWARTSARLGLHEAARKAQVETPQLAGWERGDDRPSVPQLRKLARAYKRPLAVFYLPYPPTTFDALRDFRRLPDTSSGAQSPELAYEIRRARARREIALDLHRELTGDVPKEFSLSAGVPEDSEQVGLRLRQWLGVERSEADAWKTHYDAFNRWRDALSEHGVLVFQAKGVAVSEARGFSLSERILPVVVVNIKDAVVGRIFTMLHEAAHLMLREGGLCLLEEGAGPQARVEAFCNRVAAAALMPRAWLLDEEVVRRHKGDEWSEPEIGALAGLYRVSREAVVRRLLSLGKTNVKFYEAQRRHLQAEFAAREEETRQRRALGLEGGGFTPPDRMPLSTAGPYFVRLVLESYHHEHITANDLSSYLEVRLKHLPKIEQALLRRPLASGVQA